MGHRRHFTREFKRGAVRPLEQGQRPAAVIVRELEIPWNQPQNFPLTRPPGTR